jgi:hypothetical protein
MAEPIPRSRPEDLFDQFKRASGLLAMLLQRDGPQRAAGSRFRVLVREALHRLDQSTYLLQRFRQAELEHEAAEPLTHQQTADRERAFGRVHLAVEQVRLYGEAFYSFAWRVKNTLDVLKRTEGVDLAFMPVGVRDVRNRMIEHPDKEDGVYVMSWRFDCPEGLVLEPVGLDGFGLDSGLYPNAQEFIDKLLSKLTALELNAPTPGPVD